MNLGSSCFGLLSSWGNFKYLTCAIRTGFLFLLEIRSRGYSLVLGHVSMAAESKVQGLSRLTAVLVDLAPPGHNVVLPLTVSLPSSFAFSPPPHPTP